MIRGAGVRIGRQQRQVFALAVRLHIAAVDAGIGANPTAALLHDQQAASHAQNLVAVVQHDLDHGRLLAHHVRKAVCFVARLHVVPAAPGAPQPC